MTVASGGNWSGRRSVGSVTSSASGGPSVNAFRHIARLRVQSRRSPISAACFSPSTANVFTKPAQERHSGVAISDIGTLDDVEDFTPFCNVEQRHVFGNIPPPVPWHGLEDRVLIAEKPDQAGHAGLAKSA